MFLNTLKQEEKEKFLSLIYNISNIDGVYAEEEKEIIENYKIELGTYNIYENEKTSDLIEYFAAKNMQIKKVVAFEVYGLIVSDEKLDENEEKVLCEIENKFGIDADTFKAIKEAVDDLKKVYTRIYDVLA